MSDKIKIVCDHSRHPGKVDVVARFARAPDGTWDWLIPRRGGGMATHSLGILYQDGGEVRLREHHDLTCKLCGPTSHLEIQIPKANRIFDEEISLAGSREACMTLADLRARVLRE